MTAKKTGLSHRDRLLQAEREWNRELDVWNKMNDQIFELEQIRSAQKELVSKAYKQYLEIVRNPT